MSVIVLFVFFVGIAVAQYLQKVSPFLMLGAELLYQYGSTLPGGEMAMLSLAGKYTGKLLSSNNHNNNNNHLKWINNTTIITHHTSFESFF